MFQPNPLRRLSHAALVLALAALGFAILTNVQALAHHPGSHAQRLADGKVRLDVTTTVSDACTRIAAVEPGLPKGVSPVANTQAVTVRLVRPTGVACAAQVRAVREEVVLDVPPGPMLMLYVIASDGTLAGSERVPVKS